MKIKSIQNKICKLHILENLKKKNFKIERIFFLSPSSKCLRGDHAHKVCTQIFLSLNGNIEITIENKSGLKKLKLLEFKRLLKVPPLNWVKINMKKKQLLMVICDKKFSEKEYIRNYSTFLKQIKK
tara:strand:- start:176 stop:553 length:378 start_codon:yes stop_codon:yes gene_type:complete